MNTDLIEYFKLFSAKTGIQKIKAKNISYITNQACEQICIDIINKKWINNDNSQNHFFQILKKYDLLYNKHVPNDYKINDVETRMQLLAGFLDADGHLSKDNNFEFSQKSKKLFDDIVFIGRSLGLMVSVEKPKKIKGKIYHRANIYGPGIDEIPTKIHRKISKKYGHYKRNKAVLILLWDLDVYILMK